MNYTLKVAAIKKETDDAVTLCFKQPGLKKIKYDAGQYLTLIFRINGRRYLRPYSFSSCPGVDQYLEITVKRVLNGLVSNHINDAVKEGDSIEVLSPMGDFTYSADKEYSSVYLWGVGSGITPLISIGKHILFTYPEVNVHLAYGNRSSESTIFLSQISQLQEKYPARFIARHFYTRPVINYDNPDVVQGRLDEEKISEILDKSQDISNSAHYICGPSGLKESVKTGLFVKGVSPSNIYSEDFELVKNPEDFKDIQTQSIKLTFNSQEYDLEVVKGKSILESALDANIELPYSCQTGTCNTCMARLRRGQVKMIGLTHEREDLLEGEYLLCCSHPVTEDVYLEV